MYPEREYLEKLGRAVYANNYLEWEVIQVVSRLGRSIADLAPMMGGQIQATLRKAIRSPSQPVNEALRKELEVLAETYGCLIDDRNDIVHSWPATSPDNLQRLRRWAPVKNRVVFVEKDFLDDFAERVLALNSRFRSVRDQLESATP